MSVNDLPPIYVLSLDGGGVRGLSSLLILREFMHMLQDAQTPPRLPYECFHFIIGSGTGGISALFLGRLFMTVDQAIDEYTRMMEVAYKQSKRYRSLLWTLRALFSGDGLEAYFKKTVEKFLDDAEAPMADPKDPKDPTKPSPCVVAVLAATSDDIAAPPHIFRSDSQHYTFTVVQVARAATAYPSVFPPVLLGTPPISYFNAGGVGFNNPIEFAYLEASKMWPDRKILILSLGTGSDPLIKAVCGHSWGPWAEISQRILEGCDAAHEQFLRNHTDVPWWYFRLSVSQGLHEVGVKEWTQSLSSTLAGKTSAYLRKWSPKNLLKKCVDVMKGKPVPLDNKVVALTDPLLHHTLPYRPLGLVVVHGRDVFVDQAVKEISHVNVHLAILGPAGIGKTAIAQSIIDDERVIEVFKDNRYFISCEGVTSAALFIDVLSWPFGISLDPSDRIHRLVSFLRFRFARERLLLIIDGFEISWEKQEQRDVVESQLKAIACIPSVSLILTTQASVGPAGINWAPMPPVGSLTAEAALEAYHHLHQSGPTAHSVHDTAHIDLLSMVEHVPLTVLLMAHLTRAGSDPEDLMAKIQTRLLEGGPDCQVAHIVEISIETAMDSDYMKSNPDALELLGLISFLPAGLPRASIASIIDGVGAAATALETIGLVYYDSTGSLQIPSAVRTYLRTRTLPLEIGLKSVKKYLDEMRKRCNSDIGEDQSQQSSLDFEVNMEAVITRTLTHYRDELTIQVALDFSYFLSRTRPRELVIEHALSVIDPRMEEYLPLCLQRMGFIYQKLSRFEEAQSSLTEAKTRLLETGKSLGAAQCLHRLADIHRVCNRYSDSRRALEEAKLKFEKGGDRQGLAQCLWSEGENYRLLENYDEARNTLSEAISKLEASGDRVGAAQCSQSLGDMERNLSRNSEACRLLAKARLEFRVLGNRCGAAQCLQSLGEIHSTFIDRSESVMALIKARSRLHDTITLLSRVGGRFGEYGDRIEATGDRLMKTRQLVEASPHLKAREDIEHILFRNQETVMALSGTRDLLEAAEKRIKDKALRGLSQIDYILSRCDAARSSFEEAATEFEALGNIERAAQCLQSLGAIQYKLSNYDEARNALTKAKAMFDALEDQQEAARCSQSLDNIDSKAPADGGGPSSQSSSSGSP